MSNLGIVCPTFILSAQLLYFLSNFIILCSTCALSLEYPELQGQGRAEPAFPRLCEAIYWRRLAISTDLYLR